MKYPWIAAAALGLVAAAGTLHAQAPIGRPPGPGAALPPAYSPYLNLLRPNAPAYMNYYGLVRPELDWRNQVYGVQQGVAANASAISGIDAATGLPLTGHPVMFLNTSHYFLNRGGAGAAGQGQAPTRAAAPRSTQPAQPAH